MRAIRKDFGIEVNVRPYDEIDENDGPWFVDDETGIIYHGNELEFPA